jgi:cysteine desulfurase
MSSAYFDHNATTPLDPRVRDAMLPWLGELWGNPSSAHRPGQTAWAAVEKARQQVAAALGADPLEVVFTASGTEANNAVLFEVARAAAFAGEIVVSALEHPSVSRAAQRCAAAGMKVRSVAPGPDGVVSPEEILAQVTPATRLVCLMHSNNELGTLQPVAQLTSRLRESGVAVLCDAVQSMGKVAVEVSELGADFVTIGGHKFHGPQGAAALWIRPGAPFEGFLVGGRQERNRRASTLNVAAVVGLGKACELAAAELDERRDHLERLRRPFEEQVRSIPGAVIHCAGSPRLPHTSHLAFPGIEGESLVIRLDLAGYAVSTGSACSSGVVEPSPALLAMGLSAEETLSSLRVSFGLTNTVEEVEAFLPALAREVAALRQALPTPVA